MGEGQGYGVERVNRRPAQPTRAPGPAPLVCLCVLSPQAEEEDPPGGRGPSLRRNWYLQRGWGLGAGEGAESALSHGRDRGGWRGLLVGAVWVTLQMDMQPGCCAHLSPTCHLKGCHRRRGSRSLGLLTSRSLSLLAALPSLSVPPSAWDLLSQLLSLVSSGYWGQRSCGLELGRQGKHRGCLGGTGQARAGCPLRCLCSLTLLSVLGGRRMAGVSAGDTHGRDVEAGGGRELCLLILLCCCRGPSRPLFPPWPSASLSCQG